MIGKKLNIFASPSATQDQVLALLKNVIDPHSGKDIVSMGMIEGIVIDKGHIAFSIKVDPQKGAAMESVRLDAEKAVMTLKGVKKVSAILTAARAPGQTPPPMQAAPKQQTLPKGAPPQIRTGGKGAAADPHGMAKNPPLELPFKKIIAVASGKGGVGKSTVAVNLAAALAKTGLRTAMLDADIYGPSLPQMLNLPIEKPELNKIKKLVPHEAFGMKVMSMGFLIDEQTPMIWRGPMVQSAIYQMLRDVDWINEAAGNKKPADILVVDMPPGTGDAQLTMAQKVPLSGAVIVSTPQDIALLDARKGLKMFEQVNVPVLGMIENMSTFVCPNCQHETHIFGHGGAKVEAQKLGCDFLGEVPLEADIRMLSDEGKPFVVSKPNSKAAQVFMHMADGIKEKLFSTS